STKANGPRGAGSCQWASPQAYRGGVKLGSAPAGGVTGLRPTRKVAMRRPKRAGMVLMRLSPKGRASFTWPRCGTGASRSRGWRFSYLWGSYAGSEEGREFHGPRGTAAVQQSALGAAAQPRAERGQGGVAQFQPGLLRRLAGGVKIARVDQAVAALFEPVDAPGQPALLGGRKGRARRNLHLHEARRFNLKLLRRLGGRTRRPAAAEAEVRLQRQETPSQMGQGLTRLELGLLEKGACLLRLALPDQIRAHALDAPKVLEPGLGARLAVEAVPRHDRVEAPREAGQGLTTEAAELLGQAHGLLGVARLQHPNDVRLRLLCRLASGAGLGALEPGPDALQAPL